MQWFKVRGNEDLKKDGGGGNGEERLLTPPGLCIPATEASIYSSGETPRSNNSCGSSSWKNSSCNRVTFSLSIYTETNGELTALGKFYTSYLFVL